MSKLINQIKQRIAAEKREAETNCNGYVLLNCCYTVYEYSY